MKLALAILALSVGALALAVAVALPIVGALRRRAAERRFVSGMAESMRLAIDAKSRAARKTLWAERAPTPLTGAGGHGTISPNENEGEEGK